MTRPARESEPMSDPNGANGRGTNPENMFETAHFDHVIETLIRTPLPSPTQALLQQLKLIPKPQEEPDLWKKTNELRAFGEKASSVSLCQQRWRGRKLDGSFGVDAIGRIWRKENQRIWYYVPSLRVKRDLHDPLVRMARELKSTVDKKINGRLNHSAA